MAGLLDIMNLSLPEILAHHPEHIPFDVPFLTCFMDGQPEESLCYGKEDRWHTMAFVMAKIEHIEYHHGDYGFFNKDFSLRKWTGLDPLRPRKKQSRAAVSRYRKKFIDALKTMKTNGEFSVYAYSFTERSLRANKKRMLDALGCNNYHEYHDKKFNLIMHLSDVLDVDGQAFVQREDTILCLLFIAWKTKTLVEMYSHVSAAMLVKTDRIGANFDKNLAIIQELIGRPAESGVCVVYPDKDDYYAGDLLADNFAGMLNSAIVGTNTHTVVEAIAACNKRGFNDHGCDHINWGFLDEDTGKMLTVTPSFLKTEAEKRES